MYNNLIELLFKQHDTPFGPQLSVIGNYPALSNDYNKHTSTLTSLLEDLSIVFAVPKKRVSSIL